ncbi:LysM peptidoglycan-binding domain-containing protein [Candidatus Woesearchaeota archaeon]|mgnify:CR=1 FL=1|nr:LysM peptidoglycan-binding domain-containing protein [Candidatus Woesearchaeota archaeon]MBT3537682.1 LysM peptidoglycan-binding domain-containing protein [Candidatus Woesearchaeota archaeon]MBT4697813.1 LysM peptidoglycan-binding domain-containing protein [Candidatus Woesearchaeota archaeon]MBT7105351.1 LysM peptidoglycan-binding domain-containing protein [Candidatus Woesearchaeota archaeon]MBT7931542.1 LysM peptidoglycan-binding domain-containing protein [Candidatus Woesearchaeota archaeon
MYQPRRSLFYALAAAYLLLAPATASAQRYHRVKGGQSVSAIAEKTGVPLDEILSCNPSIREDPQHRIYVGQKLRLYETYRVKKGDTLSEIAESYWTTVEELMSYNGIRDQNKIHVRQKLRIPCREQHVVESGESLEEIAKREGLSVEDLLKRNPELKRNPGLIYPGQRIYVDEREPEPTADEMRKTRAKAETRKKGRTVRFQSGLELRVSSDKRLIGRGKHFWDSVGSGLPLLKVEARDLYREVSPHFNLEEFARVEPNEERFADSRYTFRHGGHMYHSYVRIDKLLLRKLERVRGRYGEPIKIDCAYRPYKHNMKVTSARKSRHISGQAVDIVAHKRGKLRRLLRREFRSGGIGEGPTTIHVDVRPQRKRWGY